MFNHVSVGTRDLARATRFYDAVLGALGYRRTMSEDFGNAWGLRWPEFWAAPALEGESTAGNGVHVAFIAPSRKAVDAFHAAALAEGGADAGAPGLRPDYTPDYYAAFVRDPDGNKLEAVHLPQVPFPEE
jgi:catechol 2,3-dioxygenase-like lactoylglutathione lyase family enzyme